MKGTPMAIKGIKEALARKRQTHQTSQNTDDPEVKTTQAPPVKTVGSKPAKRVTGRGR
jgi:hypothetical protein